MSDRPTEAMGTEEKSGLIRDLTSALKKRNAEVEKLRAALAVQTWCPDCGKVLEIPNPGIANGMEAAAKIAATHWGTNKDIARSIRAKAKEQADEK